MNKRTWLRGYRIERMARGLSGDELDRFLVDCRCSVGMDSELWFAYRRAVALRVGVVVGLGQLDYEISERRSGKFLRLAGAVRPYGWDRV